MKHTPQPITVFSFIVCLCLHQAVGQYPTTNGYPKHSTCDDLTDDDFRHEVLVAKNSNYPLLREPIALALDMDEQGNMDVFFVERHGKVKLYNTGDKSIRTIAEIETFSTDPEQEKGLVGIVLDPHFKTNRWMYLFNSPVGISVFRVSRFTLDDNKELIMSSEKVIIDIPNNSETCCHTGGAMMFDDYEDLWVTVGDNVWPNGNFMNSTDWNASAERGPSNTNSLIGGIFRIHPIPFPDSETPEPGIGRTYTVPEGNFGDYFAGYYDDQGDSERADEFRDVTKVRPEVFAKGTRNAYTIALDPVRRWVAWGDCGPDMNAVSEEHNLITRPSFMGWPYFTGDNIHLRGSSDPENVLNTSVFNTGIERLPPARPGTHNYQWQACAMTGPLYRYNGDLQSDVKLPPHFDRMWLITDFDHDWIKAVQMSEDGEQIEHIYDVFSFAPEELYRPLDMQLGPDGALYINSYAGFKTTPSTTRITRILYAGDCLPDEPKLEKAGCTNPGYEEYDPTIPVEYSDTLECKTPVLATTVPWDNRDLVLQGRELQIQRQGNYTVTVWDLAGRELYTIAGTGPGTETLPDLKNPGVYFIDLTSAGRTYRRKAMVF